MHASCHDVGDETSWAKRQVMTAVSFKAESYLWLFLSGGLNMQGLHHLLPSIGSYHLIDMWPEFRKVCRKHGVDLKETLGCCSFLFNVQVKRTVRWRICSPNQDPLQNERVVSRGF